MCLSFVQCFKSNNFCEASQAKHCQKSKALSVYKARMQLANLLLKSTSKNYGTTQRKFHKAKNASNKAYYI